MQAQILATGSAGVDVNANGHDEDGIESEEDECVNEYGFAVGLHPTELKLLPVSRKGEQQPRLQQHEQHHANYDWCPISHFVFYLRKETQERKKKNHRSFEPRKWKWCLSAKKV